LAVTIDYDQVSTLAREHLIPVLKDNFFKTTPLFVRMRGRHDSFAGGRQITQPLGFAPEGGGGQWWSGADKFDIRARNPITAAVFYARNFEVPITVLQEEEDQVNGPEEVMPLVATKLNIARRTINEQVGGSGGVYNDASNPKAITGLQYALPDFTGGAPGVFPSNKNYGGITTSSTVNTWWNSQGDNTAYATGPAASYVNQANFAPWDKMLAAQGLAAGRNCTLIVCNYGVWNDVKALINRNTVYNRPQQSQAMHEAGFDSFMYNGKTVVVDPFCPRNSTTKVEKVYFIDEESFHLHIHVRRNFELRPFREMLDQAAQVAYLFFRGEITFDERRTSGVHSNVDTTLTSP